MSNDHDRSAVESQLRKMIEGRGEAVRAGDVDALMAGFAPDVVSFDALDPLRQTGAEVVRKRLEEWLASYRGSVGYELRELVVTAADDVAFCHGLNHVTGTLKTGDEVDMWVRSTVCFRRIDGRWLVTHEHTSSPFDPATGQASVTLQP